jgi:hypothetical protein
VARDAARGVGRAEAREPGLVGSSSAHATLCHRLKLDALGVCTVWREEPRVWRAVPSSPARGVDKNQNVADGESRRVEEQSPQVRRVRLKSNCRSLIGISLTLQGTTHRSLPYAWHASGSLRNDESDRRRQFHAFSTTERD